MKLGTRPWMMLAVAVASMGCGDDGGASGGGGSTGGSSSGTTGDDTMQSTASTSGSTSPDDTTTTGGSSEESGTSSGSSTGSADDTGSSSSTGTIDTVTLSGIVTDFGSPDPLPGIEVCVFGQEDIPCATTNATGAYTLEGVPVAEGAIEFTGPSRFPSLFWGEGPMQDQTLDYNLLSTLAANVLAGVLGEAIDDARGHLALAVVDGDGALLSGVSFAMTPSSGVVGYLIPGGIDPTLTETSEVGFAGWLNVEAGEVEITASHPTLTCLPGPGALVGSTPDALRIEITAAYLGSTFPFVCS